MRPLRIAQLCADRGIAPGGTKGAAQHLRGVAVGATNLGHHVTTYARRAAEGTFPTPLAPLDDLLGDTAASAADAAGIDVVYERYSLGHLGGLELAQRIGVPFVLEVNAPLVDEAERHRPGTVDPADRDAEQRLLADADLVITVSSPLAAWVRARRDRPTVVIGNGFAPEWFRSRPSSAPTYDLAFVGHPKPWHGVLRLVDVLVALRDLGHVAQCLVVGGGPGADQLLDCATAAGVHKQLHITGAVPPEQAAELLADARVGVAPYPPQSPFYFSPLKVLDYLAAGLAVVSTDQGDIAELVADAGVVVPADDDAALIAAVADLLADPERARRAGHRGRQRAFEALTWGHVAARTIDAIDHHTGVSAAGTAPGC